MWGRAHALLRVVGLEDGAVVVEDVPEDRVIRVGAVVLVVELDDAVPHRLVGEGVDVKAGEDDVGFLVGIEPVADVGGVEGDGHLDAGQERVDGRELVILPVVEEAFVGGSVPPAAPRRG